MIFLAILLTVAVNLTAPAPHKHAPKHHKKAPPETPRSYTRHLAAAQYGWTGAEWNAIEEIVRPESGWNPCAVNPSRSECNYAGNSSCGIPQATPCPAGWQSDSTHRNMLARTWKAQCRWLLAYIENRYHRPTWALSFRRVHNWY